MQIIEDPRKNVGSAIGAGLGQGLSQGFSKAFEQKYNQERLSQGLENLKTQDYTNPLDAVQQLIKSGATESQLTMLMPLVERQMQNKAFLKKHQNGMTTHSNLNEPQTNIISPESTVQQKEQIDESLIQPGAEQKLIKRTKLPTENELDTLAAYEYSNNPGLYKSPQEAKERIRNEYKSRIERENTEREELQASKDLKTSIRDEAIKRAGYNLSVPGVEEKLYEEVPGESINKWIDEIDPLVAKGKITQEKASEIVARNIKNLADVRTANRVSGEDSGMWPLKKYSQIKSEVESQQKKYADYGEQKTMVSDLMKNHRMSRGGASAVAYPIKNNPQLNQKLNSLPANVNPITQTKKGIEVAQKIAEDLPKLIKKDDSIQAIGYKLSELGYNADTFINTVRKLYQDGKISLTLEQQNELDYAISPTMGDLYFFSLSKIL